MRRALVVMILSNVFLKAGGCVWRETKASMRAAPPAKVVVVDEEGDATLSPRVGSSWSGEGNVVAR